jgi:hypothetical protein
MADIGRMKAILDVDSKSGEASLQRISGEFKAVGDAATQAGEKVSQSGDKVDRAAKLKEQAIERARRAFEREKLAQDRAIDAERAAAREKELAALKADILSRSIEKETVAQERLAMAKEMARGALEFAGVTASVGFVVEKMTELVRSTVEMGVELGHLSQQTGMSVETLSVLKYAAQTTGIEFEALTKGFKKLSTEAYDATERGAKTAVRAFSELGISVADLKAKNNDLFAVLEMVSNRFKEMPDGIQKNALATELFGRAGQQLIPILNQGAEAIERLKASAPIFTDADVEAMEKLHKATVNLDTAWHRLGLTLAEAFGPAATSYLNNYAAGLQAIVDTAKKAPNLFGRIFGGPGSMLFPPEETSGGGESKPGGSVVPPHGDGGHGGGGGRGKAREGAVITVDTEALDELALAAMDAFHRVMKTQWRPDIATQSATTDYQIPLESLKNLNLQPLRQLNPAIAGAKAGLDELASAFSDTAAMMRDLVVRSVNDLNQTLVGKMFGDKGASFSRMFSDIGHEAAKSGLQMLEGSVLKGMGFGKHDGSSAMSPLYVIDVSGAPGTAVPGADGALGKLGHWLGGALHLPGFAEGGEVPSNLPILVGEHGPEPFIPRTAGTIIPNDQWRKGFGGGPQIGYIDARGTDPALTRENFARAIEHARISGAQTAMHAMNERQARLPRR